MNSMSMMVLMMEKQTSTLESDQVTLHNVYPNGKLPHLDHRRNAALLEN